MFSLPGSSDPQRVKRWARAVGARCDLCPNRKEIAVGPTPPGEGRRHRLTLVGEAPGRTEQKLGAPFLGLSGKLVDSLMGVNRLRRDETYMTNAALCRGESDRGNELAADFCAPRLFHELRKHESYVPIAPLGKSAVKSLLGLKSILLVRGFVWKMPAIDTAPAIKNALRFPPRTEKRVVAELKRDTVIGRDRLHGRTVLPSIHPAFVLRTETWHPVIRADFRRIGKAVRGELDRKLADQGVHRVTVDVRDLYKMGPVIALDVETTHTGSALTAELLCVGMSDGGISVVGKDLREGPENTVVLWPWKGPTMARGLAKFLRTRKAVVGHNLMNFDKIVLEMHGVR